MLRSYGRVVSRVARFRQSIFLMARLGKRLVLLRSSPAHTKPVVVESVFADHDAARSALHFGLLYAPVDASRRGTDRRLRTASPQEGSMNESKRRGVMLLAMFAAAVSVANIGTGVAMASTLPTVPAFCGGSCTDCNDCGSCQSCKCQGSGSGATCQA
jgi:hypothetical protein